MAAPLGIFGIPRTEEDEKDLPTIPVATQQRMEANHSRVQGNIQTILDNDGSYADIGRYLRADGIDFDVDKEEPKEPEDVNAKTVGLSFIRGSIRGTFGLAALPFLATDAIGFAVRRIFDETAEFEAVMSGKISGGGEEISKFFDPNFSFEKGEKDVESAFTNRLAEKIGEFVTPGGLLVKGMTSQGAKLLAKNPDAAGLFKSMFIQAAKNPIKTQFYEAGLGMTAATAGELVATNIKEGGNPAEMEKIGWARFAAEMVSIFGVTISQRLGAKLVDLARSKLVLTPAAQKLAAEIKFGELLNEVMEADPAVLRSIRRAEELEKLTGIKFTMDEVFQNPDIQSAVNSIIKTGSDLSQTRYLRMLESSRERINQIIKELEPVINKSDNLKTSLSNFMTKKFGEIDDRVLAAERRAVEEADLLHPERTPESIGQSGMEQMRILEEEAQEVAEALLKPLVGETPVQVNHIKASLQLAKHDPRFAAKNVAREAEGLDPVGLAGREFGDIPEIILQVGRENFGKDINKVDIAALMEWRRLIGKHERLAGIAGDTDTLVRLDFLRKGVDRQFAAASRGSRVGKAATTIKEFNKQWTAFKTRFDRAYERLGIQKDLTSMYKFAPEDFWKKFIRPESAKQASESVRLFKQIFGDTPAAKALIVDSVAYQLSKFKTDKGFDMRAMQGWLNRHKVSLKKHGVWDQFKDVGQATVKAEEFGQAAIVSRKEFEKSDLQALLNTNNIRGEIQKHLRNGTLGRASADIRAMGKMPASRAWTREVWNTILSKGDTGGIDTFENMVRNPNAILKVLMDNKKDIIAGIGNAHYKNLLTIAKTVNLKEGTVRTIGKGSFARKFGADEFDEETIAKGTSKVYAAARQFVSPQFAFFSIARQGVHIVNSRAARNVLEEAAYDWRYAKKLADAAKTREGRQAMRVLGIAAIPATRDVINQDDERTEF